MPKATQGGASDVNVDPDYIAPAGVPPQDALDQGLPDAGRPADEPREADAAPDTGQQHQSAGKQDQANGGGERDETAQNKDRAKLTPAKKAAASSDRSHITRNDNK